MPCEFYHRSITKGRRGGIVVETMRELCTLTGQPCLYDTTAEWPNGNMACERRKFAIEYCNKAPYPGQHPNEGQSYQPELL